MIGLNGQTGEYMRWLIGVGAAALVAYFTTIGAMQAEVSAVKAQQESQFQEVLRRLEILQADIREIRVSQARR